MKEKYNNLWSALGPLMRGGAMTAKTLLSARSFSKTNFLVFFGVIIFFVGLASIYFYLPRGGDDSSDDVKAEIKGTSLEASVNTLLSFDSGELVGVFTHSERGELGDLLIDIYNVVEEPYRTLQTDADGNRIYKDYLGINIRVFNVSSNERDELLIGLEDDLGNEYKLDPSLAFYLGNVREYTWDKYVYPRTIREGYLLFPPPHKDAKKLNLIFFSGVRGDKIVFELDR